MRSSEINYLGINHLWPSASKALTSGSVPDDGSVGTP